MSKSKKHETKEKETKNNKKMAKASKIKIIGVLIALALFLIGSVISLRSNYLTFLGIGENYLSVFRQNMENQLIVFATSFVCIFIFVYFLNKFTKKGLKKFFEEEKKPMPKLPNKSLALIFALIGAIFAYTTLTDKFAVCFNAAVFGQNDPLFNMDISFYMFVLPFINSLLIYIIEILGVSIIYTALYYVIALNVFFEGVDVETLKKNTFIKQILFLVIVISIVLGAYIFINSTNIMNDIMLTVGDEVEVELVGAGKTDATIKVWGYKIFSVLIVLAVIGLINCIRIKNFKKGMLTVLSIPTYLVGMFVVLIYFQNFHIKNNELDNEQQYILNNIKNTKEAYGIDIDQQNIADYSSITSSDVIKNSDVINNFPLITKGVTLDTINEHQENTTYYNYENTFLATYKIDNQDKLVYITPREILNDSTISYNKRTLSYTHGYSAVISSATTPDEDGYINYITSDFSSDNVMNIKQPRIYFGLQTNSTIMTNTKYGEEFDYPLTASTSKGFTYDGAAGLNLGFMDRLVLAIRDKNIKLAFSGNITDDTKIISDRNVIERAKKILPNILYDENPYLVIRTDGSLTWVIDGYTRSNEYPYSQSSTINIKGYKEEINYIRNSVKVLIDAYDGTTTFYITDKSDPIIMTYRNIYPDLFEESAIPVDVQAHLVYPEFLYNIQTNMLNIYHDISEDSLYRADDIWSIASKNAGVTSSTLAQVQMEPYYTSLKTIDSNEEEFGLVIPFTKYGKQNIISYAVGTVRDGKSVLSLYKFNSENNVVGIIQLNNQIEQDETISKELENLNTTGTKLIKNMIIIPIDNSLLYVEPVYQVMLNESEIPVLKKVIVASGNTVAIGNDLASAINNLFSDEHSVDLEIIDIEDINALIDSVIKANANLSESLNANNFELIGKDIQSLQKAVVQLQATREKELKKQKELNTTSLKDSLTNISNETNTSITLDNSLSNVIENVNK